MKENYEHEMGENMKKKMKKKGKKEKPSKKMMAKAEMAAKEQYWSKRGMKFS